MEPLLNASRCGLGQRRLVGREAEGIDKVVHALEHLHACLKALALRADLLEREERGHRGRRSVSDHLREADLVRSPLADLVARNGHQADDFASLDERHEQPGREVVVLSDTRRDALVARIVHRDGPLLAHGPATRCVLGQRRVGMELFHSAIGPDRVAVREVRLPREEVQAVDRERVLRRLVDDAHQLVELAHARERKSRVPRHTKLDVL